jgi:DNA-binding NarL/FixJ family response regulator
MSLRLLIADDQQLIRDGFRMILATATDIEIVGEARNGQEAVSLTRELRPDVVLMDIRMPELDGIEATRRILARKDDLNTSVLILTTFDLDEYVYDALRAGANGFLLKDVPGRQLIAAIRTVGEGDALLSPSITRRLIEEFSATRAPQPPAPQLADLTARELDVFRLVAAGKTNRGIATELIIAETTVKTHITHILMKLGVRDRVQAVILAYETGLATPGRAEQPTAPPGDGHARTDLHDTR